MSDQKSSYRQIFKATSLFGGVQVFTIIISIIRSKFIAVLLGPSGMGIAGLLTSTTGFIAALTNFGLERSAVKNIASSNSTGNVNQIAKTVKVLRKMVWATGFLGAIVTLIFSQFLSKLTFGTNEYTYAFVWLSITLLLNQIRVGQSAVLRGTRKLKYMAKSSLWGSIIGLFISVPIYYFWGTKGIVPAIVITAISTLGLTFYYSQKVNIVSVKVAKTDFLTEGKDMLSMGFIISLGSLVVLGTSYLVRIFIRNIGSIDDVGFYNAGFAIVNTYFGVFSPLLQLIIIQD
jgi:O-antigen/teichoic acid export membrane protein